MLARLTRCRRRVRVALENTNLDCRTTNFFAGLFLILVLVVGIIFRALLFLDALNGLVFGTPVGKVLVLVIQAVFLVLVIVGIYGAYTRKPLLFRSYTSALGAFIATLFVINMVELLSQSSTKYCFTFNNQSYVCYPNTSAYIAVEADKCNQPSSSNVSIPITNTTDPSNVLPPATDPTSQCALSRTLLYIILAATGLVFPLLCFLPCFFCALQFQSELLFESKDVNIDLTTAPYGGTRCLADYEE